MTEIKTKLGENDAASTPFRPATGIAESNVQDALEAVYAAIAAQIAAHEAEADPHPVYLTEAEGDAAYDAIGTAAGLIAAHEAAANPHPGYLTQAEADLLYEALNHTHPASEISDSTAAGRALLTAADAAAQRTALGLATIATSASASDLTTGTVPDARMPAHTGDVTSSAGAVALTIANDAVTNAKLANMAAGTYKMRVTGSTGDPEDATAAQATAGLNAMVGDSGSGGTKGLVPAPAAGDAAAGKFLKADGTWAAPPSSGLPTGAIFAWPTSTAPTGALECDGSAVSRTTYAALFAVIGDDYGAGDGSTTFNLPDFRGEFLRGWDHGRGADPDAASRTNRGDGTTGDAVGTKQSHQFASHTHSGAGANGTANGNQGTGGSQARHVGTQITNATGGNETRPRNVNVMWCIAT